MKPRRCTLPGARVENSPKFADRMRDISAWREGDIRSLSTRAKKKYYRRKSAIEDYFTSNISIDEITLRKQISSERLLQLAQQCLMQAEDGSPWGFRALMPGVNVIDYAAQPTAAGAAPSPEIPGEDTQNLNRETKRLRTKTMIPRNGWPSNAPSKMLIPLKHRPRRSYK